MLAGRWSTLGKLSPWVTRKMGIPLRLPNSENGLGCNTPTHLLAFSNLPAASFPANVAIHLPLIRPALVFIRYLHVLGAGKGQRQCVNWVGAETFQFRKFYPPDESPTTGPKSKSHSQATPNIGPCCPAGGRIPSIITREL